MSMIDALQRSNGLLLRWCMRACGCTALAMALSVLFAIASHAQVVSETVEFDIPASTLPQALRVFARQSRVELVFAESGFDHVRTRAVVGAFPRERALELLLEGTGLQVGYGSGASLIVQRVAVLGMIDHIDLDDDNPAMALLAQAAADESQRAVNDTGAYARPDDQSPVPTNRSHTEERLEEITVTGRRIRGVQSASPIVTIDRAEVDLAGFATVEAVVEYLPQNFEAGANADRSSVNPGNTLGGTVVSSAGGTSVNLRGLGTDSTLVLLNGRRMTPDGLGTDFAYIVAIPVTAIKRVDLVTDGASAIYGPGARDGVVSVVMRNDCGGAETHRRDGTELGDGTGPLEWPGIPLTVWILVSIPGTVIWLRLILSLIFAPSPSPPTEAQSSGPPRRRASSRRIAKRRAYSRYRARRV